MLKQELCQEICHTRRSSAAAVPQHRRRQLGWPCIRPWLHNFHLLYLFTDAAGPPAAHRPTEKALPAPAPLWHGGCIM